MDNIRQTKLEVNTENVIYNINQIKEYVGNDVSIMPIIKSNGYGTYINQRMDIFEKTNIHIVGVAIVDEGVYIRKQGYDGDIFILNQPLEDEIQTISQYNLTVGTASKSFIQKLGEYNSKFKIHIELGTGMGRTGINPNRLNEYIDYINQYDNIQIEGIYTHFSCSDCDLEYTKKQINSFNFGVNIVKDRDINLKYIHCCNSAGIINFKNAHFNLVRLGIMLYGYYPNDDLKNKIELKPVLKLKSKISYIKEVGEGTSISYGRTFITNRKSKIATVPIGYADGIRRAMSNKGHVVINNQLVSIVGTVCMDSFMIDITDIPNVKER